MPLTESHYRCVYGFEREDLAQERELGKLMAERIHPGNDRCKEDRKASRVGRHRAKEARYNDLKHSLRILPPKVDDRSFEQLEARMLLHEIMDLMPLTKQEEILKALAKDDGRTYRKLGREIKSLLGPSVSRINEADAQA